METNTTLNAIYKSISDLKFEFFLADNSCLCNDDFTQNICKAFVYDCYLIEKGCHCYKVNLINLIIKYLCKLENKTNCCKNYAYLLQIDRLKCIIKNFEKLLCQLKCLQYKDCCLFSKLVCTLYKILEYLDNIFSKINNLEILCKSHICCDDDIISCILCSLIEDVNLLEENVLLLSELIVKIASQNVINCTPCSTVKSILVDDSNCYKYEDKCDDKYKK